ncbi:MAG: ACT domain-containing protein [Chlamydiota bacterium]
MLALVLILLTGDLSVCQMNAKDPIPSWASSSKFFSITRTEDELSVVCSSDCVPDEIKCEKDWIAYKVVGPLDFGLTGILASIAKPLAEANISIFAISTYDTDYILIKKAHQADSIEALKNAGFTIELQCCNKHPA